MFDDKLSLVMEILQKTFFRFANVQEIPLNLLTEG